MNGQGPRLAEMWTTREAAECLGWSESTLKNWDEKGWLSACQVDVHRTPAGYRRFIPDQIRSLASRIERQEIRIVDGHVQRITPERG